MQRARRRLRVGIAVVAFALALVAASCGNDDTTTADTDEAAATSEPASPSSTSASTTTGTAATPDACTGGSLDPVATPPSQETAYLVDASVTDGCVVSFTFRDGTPAPGYDVAYDPGPFQFGEGQTLEVEGAAFLLVRMTFASRTEFADDGSFTTVYDGPEVLESSAPPVTQVAFVDDFENEMRWVIGLEEERPFSVTMSESPPTITVAIG